MPLTPETALVTHAQLTALLGGYASTGDAENLAALVEGLRTDLGAQMAKPDIYWIDTPDDVDQLPPGVRPDHDVVFVRSETEAPPTVSAYRRALLTGLPADSALPQALGTGDTPLTVVPSGTHTVRSRNGRLAVEVGLAATTSRWSTDLGLTKDEWSFDIALEVEAHANTFTTWYQLTGVCTLSLSSTSTLTVNAWNGSAFVAVGTSSPALALSTLSVPKVYRVKGWKADADTLAHFKLYDPTGAVVWDVTRDVGTATPSALIWGRTGSVTTGKHYWSGHRFHNVSGELV